MWVFLDEMKLHRREWDIEIDKAVEQDKIKQSKSVEIGIILLTRRTMTNMEQTILLEISTLPERRLADVLTFVRYLKLSIPTEEKELEERFDRALKFIRARAKEMNITDEDIEAEIRAVREGK